MKVTVYRGENFVATNEFVLHKAAGQPLLQPTLVLVPDRFTLQAERLLLKDQPHLLNTRVVTFSMLYRLVADEINFNQPAVEVLDKTSAVLNLWTAIHKIQGQLTWFKTSAGHYDFAEKMFNTINQMRSSCVDFASLENQAQSAVAKKKYHDINLIYQAYCQIIAPRTDSSGMLDYLTAHAAQSKVVQDADIFVCGFTSLSPARLQVLGELCQAAKSVTIAASEDELCAQLSKYKPYRIEVDAFAPKTITMRNETERGEANLVIEKIVQLIADGVPPEDIVVLLTEFDTLAPVWQVVADKYRLPVNLDVGTKLSTLPEAKYLRDLLETLANDDAENTVAVLFNRCSGIDDDTVYALDNKIVASDLRARMVPEIKQLTATKNVVALCEQLQSLTTNEKLQNILEQIATECREQPFNLREFITLFWTLCSATKVSNIPQYVDRVLIAPVNDWVPSRVQYLFIANCTADNFPQPQADDDILQEVDLVGTQITPTPSLQRARNYRRAELLQTVATQQVILSGTHEDFTAVPYTPVVNFQWQKTDTKPITVGRALFFPENRVKPTMLESYYNCPYLNFVQNGLQLRPRALHSLDPNTVGSAIHAALQDYFVHFNVEQAIAIGKAALDFDYPPLTKNIEKEMRFIINRLAKTFQAGKFTLPTQVETTVQCQLPHDLVLSGRVDRIDWADLGNGARAFLVLDYKTGRVDHVARSIYLGDKLQLPIYSSALLNDNSHLAGAGYLPLKSGFATDQKTYSLNGFVNETYQELFPADLLGDDTAVLSPDVIHRLCAHARQLVDQAVARILAGDVTPQVVTKNHCEYCPLKGLCSQAQTNCRDEKIKGKKITYKIFEEGSHE
ncbi:MAG: PD-(D/E)XK nuclease family protein [Eubacteriales bacterium]|nr:PD-(D/E)XK nuclease family protein [Eubacteriales bacterium]